VIDAEGLVRIQQASYERAGSGLRGAWPPESAMDASQLASFLVERRFCVLATTTPKGRPQARPVGFTVFGTSFWVATVAGGRLRNVEQTPWVSLVVAEGDRGSHSAVVVDGPVAVVERLPEELLAAWEDRHGSRADWAAAWLEVQPARLFSYLRR
jgi:nitroimidazol reductase NimA-like FMN-containing flavoprotein (pyridoxamine 5'-phosphate oxidase superfamily)